MTGYHAHLALDYLVARPAAERTPDTLRTIVAHLCTTYCVSATDAATTQDAAQTLARQRHLLSTPATGPAPATTPRLPRATPRGPLHGYTIHFRSWHRTTRRMTGRHLQTVVARSRWGALRAWWQTQRQWQPLVEVLAIETCHQGCTLVEQPTHGG